MNFCTICIIQMNQLSRFCDLSFKKNDFACYLGNRLNGAKIMNRGIRETRQGAVEITQARKMMMVAFPSVMVDVIRKSLILRISEELL